MMTAQDAPPVIDAARLVLALIAGGTLAQLCAVAWQDRKRPADRHRLPAQLALLLSLLLIATDSALRVGEQFTPHLFLTRAAIVACATWYVLDRQGYLKGRR